MRATPVRPGPGPVYVVERFDRRVGDDGKVVRHHAEDFCQALGHLPTVKYETEGGPGLAPFYDLLCTGAYPDLSRNLAMRIGGEARPAWLRRRHWERFAEQVEIGPRLVLDSVARLAASLPATATALAAEQAATLGPSPVVDRVLVVIRARCAQAERALASPGRET